ncbi:MAG: hypothetical protein ABIN80_17325 [Dyadobacter sp.]|uniref:hypothetical protein n=1 Tax=Dyadobacter sp. TaxID=1914288 RepID=UPI003267A48D
MTSVKLIILFIIITMMQHHGIIYRTGKRDAIRLGRDALKDAVLPRSSNLNGSWRLTEVNDSDPAMTGQAHVEFQRPPKNQDLMMSFFQDGTFTQIKDNGEYSFGTWSYDSLTESVFLTSNKKTEEIRTAFGVGVNGLRMLTFEFSQDNSISLIENARRSDQFKEDPFYAENNKWRLKPTENENERQIRDRLKNYILHNIRILKAAGAREQVYVSKEFSEGIIKFYNVGIGVVERKKIPQTWINSFYSRENALQAYGMFEDYLRYSDHKKHATGNWVRDDSNILTDIHNGLK